MSGLRSFLNGGSTGKELCGPQQWQGRKIEWRGPDVGTFRGRQPLTVVADGLLSRQALPQLPCFLLTDSTLLSTLLLAEHAE
jgi:hypothetical protein